MYHRISDSGIPNFCLRIFKLFLKKTNTWLVSFWKIVEHHKAQRNTSKIKCKNIDESWLSWTNIIKCNRFSRTELSRNEVFRKGCKIILIITKQQQNKTTMSYNLHVTPEQFSNIISVLSLAVLLSEELSLARSFPVPTQVQSPSCHSCDTVF